MNFPVLLIRADANVSIGTGHVMRCFALAEAWQNAGGTARFISCEMPPKLKSRLTAQGIAVSEIDLVPGSPADAAATTVQAAQLNADWIAVDGDRFASDFLSRLRDARFRVLLFDDFAERQSFLADIILNPNLGADENVYKTRPDGSRAQILAGPRYALLRSEFCQPIERTHPENGNRVLITLGGSDPENLALRIAAALVAHPKFQLTVVAGPGYPAAQELQKICRSPSKVLLDPQNLAELMTESDIAIIAAGGTLWELLASGCAVLSYSRNPVQSRVIEMLAREETVVDMGATSRFDPPRLVSELERLAASKPTREKMASRGRALIDCGGVGRVIAAMQNRENTP